MRFEVRRITVQTAIDRRGRGDCSRQHIIGITSGPPDAPIEDLANKALALQAPESIKHVHIHNVEDVVFCEARVLLRGNHALCTQEVGFM